MSSKCDLTFLVNRYDSDGDIVERGVFLYFNDTTSVKIAETIADLDHFKEQVTTLVQEIKEGHYFAD